MNIYKRIKRIILSELAVNPRAIRLTPGQLARERVQIAQGSRGNTYGGQYGTRSSNIMQRKRRHMTGGQKLAQDIEYSRRPPGQ